MLIRGSGEIEWDRGPWCPTPSAALRTGSSKIAKGGAALVVMVHRKSPRLAKAARHGAPLSR